MKEQKENSTPNAAGVEILSETFPDLPTMNRIIELGSDFEPQEIANSEKHGPPFIMVPSGMRIEDLTKYSPLKRISQQVKLLEPGSFSDYVNDFKTPHTQIFADLREDGATFLAVMDYHQRSTAGSIPQYCWHVARYDTILSHEWKVWKDHDRKKMTQVEFAEFLEDNLSLFHKPNGADLLELVSTLFGKADVRYNSAIRLQSGGAKLNYDEDVVLKAASSTTSGEVDIPATITAGIKPIEGAVLYEVKARLKYRINDRKLILWYETADKHKIMRDSLMEVVKAVTEKTTIVPLLGMPALPVDKNVPKLD